jgi:aminoglycoside phosphotransferase (APT) family kinase protein
MAYGFDVPGELEQLLRGSVPPQVLSWVERETGSRVLGQRALRGGTSAAMHRLTLEGRDAVVVRRFVLDWIAEEPWAPMNEATVLGLLATAPVPAPHLVAVDLDGAITGVPAVVMSALRGDVVWDPPDLHPWLSALVELLTAIHAVPVADSMRRWAPYPPEGAPPAWTRHQWAWEQAVAAYEGEQPASDRVFLHRDFHPGNVLWEANRITGVVDWVSSCAGPPEEDVAHCRVNLARHHGQETADRFLDLWQRASGRTAYSPYWDLVDVVSMGGSPPNDRLDAFVAAAAARL